MKDVREFPSIVPEGDDVLRSLHTNDEALRFVMTRAGNEDVENIIDLIDSQSRYDMKLSGGNDTEGKIKFIPPRVTREECRNFIQNEFVFVARHDDTIVGCIFARYAASNIYAEMNNTEIEWENNEGKYICSDSDCYYIWMVSVHHDYQGKGVGSGMVDHLVRIAGTNLVSVVLADCMVTPVYNFRSQIFFKEVGFKLAGKLNVHGNNGNGRTVYAIYYKKVDLPIQAG